MWALNHSRSPIQRLVGGRNRTGRTSVRSRESPNPRPAIAANEMVIVTRRHRTSQRTKRCTAGQVALAGDQAAGGGNVCRSAGRARNTAAKPITVPIAP